MQATDRLVDTIIEAVDERQNKKAKSYDTPATVTRVEGSTAYVHIAGGVDETPAAMTINAKKGDTVQVRVGGGRAWLVGNATNPPTDDSTANIAQATATTANVMAGEAIESANIAQEAADSAVASAAVAEASAISATTSANSALTQLSIVEDVVDVLNWISEHGTYIESSDTSVVQGKYYFTRTGSGTEADPYVYSVVTSPSGSPADNGYFELDSVDEAVTNYISTHLALTDDGLYLVGDSGWKVLIKPDGVEIQDTTGTQVANYGTSITLGKESTRHLVIDSDGLECMADADYTPLSLDFSTADSTGATATFTTANPQAYTTPSNGTEAGTLTLRGDTSYGGYTQLISTSHGGNTASVTCRTPTSTNYPSLTLAVSVYGLPDSGGNVNLSTSGLKINMSKVLLQLKSGEALYTAISNLGWTSDVIE